MIEVFDALLILLSEVLKHGVSLLDLNERANEILTSSLIQLILFLLFSPISQSVNQLSLTHFLSHILSSYRIVSSQTSTNYRILKQRLQQILAKYT